MKKVAEFFFFLSTVCLFFVFTAILEMLLTVAGLVERPWVMIPDLGVSELFLIGLALLSISVILKEVNSYMQEQLELLRKIARVEPVSEEME